MQSLLFRVGPAGIRDWRLYLCARLQRRIQENGVVRQGYGAAQLLCPCGAVAANQENRVRLHSSVPHIPRGSTVPITRTIIQGMLTARC